MSTPKPKPDQPRAAGGRFAYGDGKGKAIPPPTSRTAVFDQAEAARNVIPEDSVLDFDLQPSSTASGPVLDVRPSPSDGDPNPSHTGAFAPSESSVFQDPHPPSSSDSSGSIAPPIVGDAPSLQHHSAHDSQSLTEFGRFSYGGPDFPPHHSLPEDGRPSYGGPSFPYHPPAPQLSSNVSSHPFPAHPYPPHLSGNGSSHPPPAHYPPHRSGTGSSFPPPDHSARSSSSVPDLSSFEQARDESLQSHSHFQALLRAFDAQVADTERVLVLSQDSSVHADHHLAPEETIVPS